MTSRQADRTHNYRCNYCGRKGHNDRNRGCPKRCRCINCNGDQCETCFECKPIHQQEGAP
jgi:hypothetical protein